MEYRLGNSKRIHAKGQTVEIECPSCKNNVSFGIYTNMDTRLVAKPSLIDVSNINFLVCPCCAALYTVDEELLAHHKRKELLVISTEELKELKEYK